MEDVGTILPQAFKRHLSCPAPKIVEVLCPLWWRIVGKLIAQHSRPARFSDGTLILSASNPPWAAQLSQMAEEIRAQVNTFLAVSVVRKIRVRCQPISKAAGSAAAPPAKAIVPKRTGSSSDEIKRLLWADGNATLDADLAAVVEQSFVKYFSRDGKEPDVCL
jgi:hypothetical protein